MQLNVITPDVHVMPSRGRIRTTTEDVIIIWRHRVIYIAAPFAFDGASVPFFLWWWCSPWTPWVVLAACVHDYLYRFGYYNRRGGDRIFLAILVHKAHQSRWRWLAYRRVIQARIMYAAVRSFGEPYYHRKR